MELVSTGATARRIADAGIPVTPVEQLTGFPECLDGRVKTLHPAVHAGILADRRKPEHVAQLDELGIAAVRARRGQPLPVHRDGGLRRRARRVRRADRHRRAGDGARRGEEPPVGRRRRRPGPLRRRAGRRGRRRVHPRRAAALAAAAFRHTASYDVAVASWMGSVLAPDDGQRSSRPGSAPTWERADVLRYGENPHQGAALYRGGQPGWRTPSSCTARQMSYNNYVDADAAWRAAYDHADPCVAIIKHANPCGIAVGADIAEAHRKAHACDPVSAFGGVIAANREVT